MLFLPQFYKIANQNNWPSFHPTFHLKLWIILQLFGSKQPIVWLSMQLLLIIFFLLPQKSIYFSSNVSLSLSPARQGFKNKNADGFPVFFAVVYWFSPADFLYGTNEAKTRPHADFKWSSGVQKTQDTKK